MDRSPRRLRRSSTSYQAIEEGHVHALQCPLIDISCESRKVVLLGIYIRVNVLRFMVRSGHADDSRKVKTFRREHVGGMV
jgi:hypothetical protein